MHAYDHPKNDYELIFVWMSAPSSSPYIITVWCFMFRTRDYEFMLDEVLAKYSDV